MSRRAPPVRQLRTEPLSAARSRGRARHVLPDVPL
jgi:hypothetical protein